MWYSSESGTCGITIRALESDRVAGTSGIRASEPDREWQVYVLLQLEHQSLTEWQVYVLILLEH